jgi:nucleotide-binding universal stress UspA family protein
MLNTQTLLLAHHGTAGALLAEALAFDLAVPGQTQLVHLLVVPDLWAGMQGDDWLNNASTRDTFGSYVEGLLEKDVAEQLRALKARCEEQGIAYKSVARYGEPVECLIETAEQEQATLVVIGPPRPKGTPGYRSRMELEPLVRKLAVPLIVANRSR